MSISKQTYCFIVTLLLILCGGFFIVNKSLSVAYINVPKLMEEYDAIKVLRGKLEQKGLSYKANADSLKIDFERQVKKHEMEKPKMTQKERELSLELLNRKGADLNRYQQATQQRLQEEEMELKQPELKVVNDFITEYSKAHNYDYVLAANESGVLIYAKEKLDITEDILKGLNAKYKSGK